MPIIPLRFRGGGTGGTTAAEARTNLDVYSKNESNTLNGMITGDGCVLRKSADLTSDYNNMESTSYSICRTEPSTVNGPNTSSGIAFTYKSSTNYGAQLFMSDAGIYYRKRIQGSFGEWVKVV